MTTGILLLFTKDKDTEKEGRLSQLENLPHGSKTN
jgi:hypothetical protein